MARSNRGPEVAGVAGFFLALTTIAIALRCYCRAFVVKSFGWDDNVAIIAYVYILYSSTQHQQANISQVLFVIFAGFAITGVQYGTGQHASAIPPGDIPIGLKWWWACEPVYVLSNMALKLSIGIMLYRIAVSRVHKAIIWTVMIVHTLYGAFFFFLFVLQCQPSAYFWTQYTGGKGKCINPNITVAATYGYSAISCWTDWTMAILPVFLIWNLQMNIRTKISVAMILSMGAMYVLKHSIFLRFHLTNHQSIHCDDRPHSVCQRTSQSSRFPLRNNGRSHLYVFGHALVPSSMVAIEKSLTLTRVDR